jgi:hypothetical protein
MFAETIVTCSSQKWLGLFDTNLLVRIVQPSYNPDLAFSYIWLFRECEEFPLSMQIQRTKRNFRRTNCHSG